MVYDSSIAKELTDISGYEQKRLDRTCNGGGVSISIRDSVRFKPRDDVPVDDLELICIEIEPPKRKPFLVVAWYRPPGRLVGTFEELEKVLSFLDKEGKEIMFLGDTDCDLTEKIADQPIGNDYRRMCNLYELFSLKQRIEEPTRVTLNTSTSLTILLQHVPETLQNQACMKSL